VIANVGPQKMKRIIIIVATGLALLIGVCCLLWCGYGIGGIVEGNIKANLAADLADFVITHNGRLPVDWSEFETNARKTNGTVKWDAKATAKHVQLQQPPYEKTNGIPIYIRVIDSKTHGMEYYINLHIWMALEELRQKTNAGQPTAAASPPLGR